MKKPKGGTSAGTPATYVYCVVSSAKPPSMTKVPAGPPGTRPARLLEVRPNRYLVVSDAPLDLFGEAPLAERLSDLDWVSRAAVAHDAVIGTFVTADAVLPMKVFTLFTSDQRALEQTRSDWKRIDGLLKDLAGRVEWGIRLMYDERKAPPAAAPASATSGRSYLLGKRQHHVTTVAHLRQIRKRTTGVVHALTALAGEVRQRPLATTPESGSRLLLDAAFLVPRTRETRFRAAVTLQARKLAQEGYAIHLSGPWPPYSFIEPS
jgi:hypothetical protein